MAALLSAAGLAVTVALCPSPASLAAATLDDPVNLTVVPTEGDPLDLPGREPAPKTRSEVNTPVPVQSGARPETPVPPAPPEPREWSGPDGRPWIEWSRITGDWAGSRTAMETAGLTVAGSFRIDFASLVSGGLDTGGYNRRFLDVNLTLELDAVTNGCWKGGTIYADFYHYGGETGEPSGSAQGTDVIASPRHLDQLAELWFQQVFFDGQLRVKAGKIDANVEFAALPCTTGFISACGAWDPTLLDMPTYPDPAFGALAFYTPNDSFYIGAGIFDGATHDGYPTGSRGPATFFSDSKSDSWYIIGEAGYLWAHLGDMGCGRVCLGGWHHTGDYERFDSGIDDGTSGLYITAQQQVCCRDDAKEDGEKGVFAFARLAFADGDVSPISTHFATGVVAKGTFNGRGDDEAGLMWSLADFSSESGAEGNESLVELYYTLALTGAVSVTPNIQLVTNPSGDSTVDNAFLVGLSLKVAF